VALLATCIHNCLFYLIFLFSKLGHFIYTYYTFVGAKVVALNRKEFVYRYWGLIYKSACSETASCKNIVIVGSRVYIKPNNSQSVTAAYTCENLVNNLVSRLPLCALS